MEESIEYFTKKNQDDIINTKLTSYFTETQSQFIDPETGNAKNYTLQ